jgi:hypothetical protein
MDDNFDKVKAKIIFDIWHTYHKTLHDSSSVKEITYPTHLLFQQIADEVFPSVEKIGSAYAPQDKTHSPLRHSSDYKALSNKLNYEFKNLDHEQQK